MLTLVRTSSLFVFGLSPLLLVVQCFADKSANVTKRNNSSVKRSAIYVESENSDSYEDIVFGDKSYEGFRSSAEGDEYWNNYWEHCHCDAGSHQSQYDYSHPSYPFIVVINVYDCNGNYLHSTGTGFIASSHCVVTAAYLLSPESYDLKCLKIVLSFCHNCDNNLDEQANAFNRTIIVDHTAGSYESESEESYSCESDSGVYLGDVSDGSYVYHKDYNSTTLVNNMVIIKLKCPIPFECAKPACWYDYNSEPDWYYPDLSRFPVHICGYGADNEDDDKSPCQRCIQCHQGSQQSCYKHAGSEMTMFQDTCALCPGHEHWCAGGGGSVILHTPKSDRKYRCPTVIGIASWTDDCMKPRSVIYCSLLRKKISQFIKTHCNCLAIPPQTFDDSDSPY